MRLKLPQVVTVRPSELPELTTDTIFENELVDNFNNAAVLLMRIVQAEKGFRTYVRLNWKDGEILLVTQRGDPREWVSMDRLIRHINNAYKNLPPIVFHPLSEATP